MLFSPAARGDCRDSGGLILGSGSTPNPPFFRAAMPRRPGDCRDSGEGLPVGFGEYPEPPFFRGDAPPPGGLP